jgi:hypothetical protein
MTKKRKAYRPKRIITDMMIFLRPTPPQKRQQKLLRCHTALQEISCGKQPGRDEWGELCDVVNVLETLTMHHKKLLADEVMPTLEAATTSMMDACRRYHKGQGLRLDATGLQAMRDALAMYTQVTEQLTEREIIAAEADTAVIINQHARKPRPGVEVMGI